jgi:PKD repeat protein
MKIYSRTVAVLSALAITAGCTLEDPQAPPLTGPSGFALNLTIEALPDILQVRSADKPREQSTIRITARDHNNQPVANLALRIDTVVQGPNGPVITDYGVLSTRNVVTNGNGVATVVYTAPNAPSSGADPQETVSIMVRQVGSDFGSTLPRFVSIRLVPESTALDPGAPTPNFSFAPTNPSVNQLVQFDGSSSFDPDGFIVRYRWDWGDGDFITETTRRDQDHTYSQAGTYLVTLTVTDNQGKSASVTKAITVSGT